MKKFISICVIGLALGVAMAAAPIFNPGPTCDTCVGVPRPPQKPTPQPKPKPCVPCHNGEGTPCDADCYG